MVDSSPSVAPTTVSVTPKSPRSAASINSLFDDLISHVLGSLDDGRSLGRVCQTSRRLRQLGTDEKQWSKLYGERWPRPPPPTHGWYRDYARRHHKDAAALHYLPKLADASQCSMAWQQLLDMGEEVFDCVAAVARGHRGHTDFAACTYPPTARTRDDAAKVLVGLNRTSTLQQWAALVGGGRSARRSESAVEEGALLLVRFYATTEQLLSGDGHARFVREEIDALGARLRSRLSPTYSAVEVVRALSELLCVEEGYAGNSQNYYDHRNSLLDSVLTSKRGIPISLSVLFAAVCARVGVQLDMIGLPGHFLLATRPQPPSHERVFVDVFHGGQLLTLDHCEAIVRSYNVPWSEEMARPVPVSEVWQRMVRRIRATQHRARLPVASTQSHASRLSARGAVC